MSERPTSDRHAREANAQELALVHELMRETEALRGLAFKAPVRVTIEDRTAMRAYVEHAIDDEQLDRARRRYLSLGVLDPSLDIRQLLVAMMEEELIGYYDPEQKRLAVRDEIARALERGDERSDRGLMWRATVVHELVHVLQDQHFGLGERIDELRTTDADNAFGALVEGDATLTMLGYTARLAGESVKTLSAKPERVAQLMTRTPDQLTGALRRAPSLVREPLLFRYREGATFCAELFRTGGWSAIDAAHRAPPQASQTVQDAARFIMREREPALRLPDLSWVTEHGFALRDEDVLGSFELTLVLGLDGDDASTVARGWRGDRYAVLERDQALASVWWLRFASARAARVAASAFARLALPERSVARHGETLLVGHRVPAALIARAARAAPVEVSSAAPRTRAHHTRSQRADNGAHPLATAFHRH